MIFAACVLVVAVVIGNLSTDLLIRPLFRRPAVLATAELRYAPTLVPVDLELSPDAGDDQTYDATPFDGDDVVATGLSPVNRRDGVAPGTPATVGLLYTDAAGNHWLFADEGQASAA